MKAFVKITLLLSLVLVLGAGLTFFIKDNLLNIESIQVRLSDESTEKLLFERIEKDLSSGFSDYHGKPMYDVSLKDLMGLVEADRRVQKAYVRRTFPNSITVEVVPRKPLALLLDVKGQFHPLASDASLLPSLSVNASPDLPVLRGLGFFNSKTDRLKIVEVLEAIPEEGEFSKGNVSEIRINKDKEVTLFLVDSGQQVLIGETLDKGQVLRIERVLKYLRSRSIKGRVIDARFSKKVVVRVRNAS